MDLTFDRCGLAARPAQQPTSCHSLPSTHSHRLTPIDSLPSTHSHRLTPIDMSKSQEKTGFFKRFGDFLTPSSSEPLSQPGSPSRPDRPAKDRKKFRNRLSFNKSSTTHPGRSTSPLYPTSLTEDHGAETTLGKRSLVSSVWTRWLALS